MNCCNHNCNEGRDCQWRLHTSDGGHRVDGALSVRLAHIDHRPLLGILGAAAVSIGCAVAIALGCPICIPF